MKLDWKPQHSLLWAQTTCLCLGVALVAWAVAPAVFTRLVTGELPGLAQLAGPAVALLFGLLFLGLYPLVRRRVWWAICAAFVASLALSFAAIGSYLADRANATAGFVLILASILSIASWLALDALHRSAGPTRKARGGAR